MPARPATPSSLSATSYRAVGRDEETQQLLLWPAPLAWASLCRLLPLWIAADASVPLDLEASYRATCADLRIRQAEMKKGGVSPPFRSPAVAVAPDQDTMGEARSPRLRRGRGRRRDKGANHCRCRSPATVGRVSRWKMRWPARRSAVPNVQEPLKAPSAKRPTLRTSGFALASFLLAVVGAFTVVGTIAAVILGFIAVVAILRDRERVAASASPLSASAWASSSPHSPSGP